MSTEDTSPPDDRPSSRRFPRRRLLAMGLGGILAAGAVAVGVPVVTSVTKVAAGRRVPELLRADPFTVAHRGGSADWPEMSMFAYRNAVAHGVDALEISLARTSDGVWFGLHDTTLDRTSGTSGYVASRHSWAEISRLRITAEGTSDPSQPPRPYLRFEDLVRSYGSSHTIFVDPKAVPSTYYPELLALMSSVVKNPTESFIAKGYCTSARWATEAGEKGYRTWGYYYGSEVIADPTLLPSTQGLWSLLGMDVGAPQAAWTSVESHHKKVIAHIIATPAERTRALDRGSAGLVISAIREVLG